MNSNSPQPLEADIESKCVALALAEGIPSLKADKIDRSWPDRIFFLPYSTLMIVEFKRPGERPRPQQLERHRMLSDLGHPVSVLDSVADFRSLLARSLALAH
jgi:hypothetical protein